MLSFKDVWQNIMDELDKELSDVAMTTWIRPIEPRELTAHEAVLYVRSGFQKEIISQRYLSILSSAFETVMGFEIIITLLSDDDNPAEQTIPSPQPGLQTTAFDNAYAYTFDTFIVGSGNKFAHAAAAAVAKNPATSYNPLFIYGDSGLGKTHLLNAIQYDIKRSFPGYKVVYLKGDSFTNELIESIRQSKGSEFRNKYRYADVLLMDDIQFIGGRESTQEEFFHTFNALYEDKKQIVLTSDRPPKEIQTLEDRLRTRFEWGLIADIQAPDFETRVAIVRRKASSLNLDVSQSVVDFIADRVKNNIRQLEGTVKKLKAFSIISGESPSTTSAQNAIRDILSENVPLPVTVERIISEVSRFYHISPEEIKGSKRTADISLARQVSMYIIRNVTDMSLPGIGNEFGGRDHTTVMHAVKKIEDAISCDPRFKNTLTDLMKNISDL